MGVHDSLDFDASLFALPELDLTGLDTAGRHANGRGHSRPAAVAPRAEGDAIDLDHIWRVLDTVLDPEVPAVSIRELGIVRDVTLRGEHVEVVLTPTYSGCPATEVIEASVRRALALAGYSQVSVVHRRAPAWTTDWITDEGKRKLLEYGIAPPHGSMSSFADSNGALGVTAEHAVGAENNGDVATQPLRGGIVEQPIRLVRRQKMAPVACPQCGSENTERLSAFGSTACKSLYRCRACREPFEYFKPI